jgi:hypothetical protein
MATPMPVQLLVFTGSLVLDDGLEQALLAQSAPDGNVVETLMMLDTAPVGGFDPTEVTAAWQYFSAKPGIGPGSTITIYGFCSYAPNSNRPVLHVVRA